MNQAEKRARGVDGLNTGQRQGGTPRARARAQRTHCRLERATEAPQARGCRCRCRSRRGVEVHAPKKGDKPDGDGEGDGRGGDARAPQRAILIIFVIRPPECVRARRPVCLVLIPPYDGGGLFVVPYQSQTTLRTRTDTLILEQTCCIGLFVRHVTVKCKLEGVGEKTGLEARAWGEPRAVHFRLQFTEGLRPGRKGPEACGAHLHLMVHMWGIDTAGELVRFEPWPLRTSVILFLKSLL
ncbi:hypothetical protein DFH06DRAFT_1131146 [Mycena polygramma]|nr:hypothetical protein DFH06DRAFT_1131146 [Mycena polygramma]